VGEPAGGTTADHAGGTVGIAPTSAHDPRIPSKACGGIDRTPRTGTRGATPGCASWIVRRRAVLISLAAYLLLAYVAYCHTSLLGSGALPAPADGDAVQEVWFLSWPAYALTHGHNPFLTTSLNYPVGVNLAVNPAITLLAVLALPITLLLGPVAAYNLLMVAGLATSAFAMCLVLRRWTSWWPAAFLGGLLYGFSPFMIGEGAMHLVFTFAPLPPLMLLLLDEILVRQQRRAVTFGILLGLVAAAQYLISSEVLGMAAVMAVIGVMFLAATHPRQVRPRLAHAAAAIGIAGVTSFLLLAYPLWLLFAGPEHVVGPPQPLITLSFFPGDLLGPLVPTASQLLGAPHLKSIGDALSGDNVVENGLYLGLPLACLLCVLTVAFRRVQVLSFASTMAVVAFVLALGPRLTVDGHGTGLRMPFTVLRHLPLVQDILPLRFGLFLQLFAAVALAVGVDRLWWRLPCWQRQHRSGVLARRWPWTAGAAAAVVVALLPLLPQLPIASAATDIPAIPAGGGRHQIPAQGVLLTYPYPVDPHIEGMLLQAVDGDGFRVIGSYAAVPAPGGGGELSPTELDPTYVESMFNDAYGGTTLRAIPTNDQTIMWLRQFLRRYHVGTIVAYQVGKDPRLVDRYMAATIGPPQTRSTGYRAWFDVPRLLRRGAVSGSSG
jgi:hypothetical protein